MICKAASSPRLLTKAQAATYCGVTMTDFDRWRRSGLVPDYVPGTMRFDRHALDAKLDKLSGITSREHPAEEESPLERWKRERAVRKAAELQQDENRTPGHTLKKRFESHSHKDRS